MYNRLLALTHCVYRAAVKDTGSINSVGEIAGAVAIALLGIGI